MAHVHQLVLQHGRAKARDLVSTKHERLCVDVAAEILAAESDELGITHSGFCLTALPHKEILDTIWRRENHKLTLIVEAGLDKSGNPIGVPYGPKARMILLYLQTKAIQTNCREIELGNSMRDWMFRMNISDGGKTYKQVREQAYRISACRLTFFWEDEHDDLRMNGAFVKTAINLKSATADIRQQHLWKDTVELDESFFEALKAHPVPLWEPALRQISGKSLAIDIYIWLAYRLRSLKKPLTLSWPSIHRQFGAGYKEVWHLKPQFTDALKLALAVYPEAVVDVTRKAVTLHPSPPPVSDNRLISMR